MDQEDEDALDLLKKSMVEVLKDMSYIGFTIQKKCTSFLTNVNEAHRLDADNLETVGLGIIKLLKTANRNMIAITDCLDENLGKLNNDREKKLFTHFSSELLDYRSKQIAATSRNERIPLILCDKAMQTNFLNLNNDSGDNILPKTEDEKTLLTSEIEEENKPQIDLALELRVDNPVVEDTLRKNSLGLKRKTERTDTQDTDDCWTDSLVRSPTGVDLWNREYRGAKINATDEFWDQVKKEQEEDDEWDRKTVDLNLDIDKDSSDDTFVDGQTPDENLPQKKLGDATTEEELVKNETDEVPKEELSFVTEEHKLPDLDLDKASNNTNSKDDSIGIGKSSIIETDLQPETDLRKDASTNITSSKDISSSTPNSFIDYDNPIPGCSKSDKTYSENIVHSSEKTNNLEPNEVEKPELEGLADSDFIETEISDSVVDSSLEINCSQSTNKVDPDHEESTKLDLPQDEYISPYSVETVKLGSDSEKSPSSQCSEYSDSNELTQVLIEDSNTKENSDDSIVNTDKSVHQLITSNKEKDAEKDESELCHDEGDCTEPSRNSKILGTLEDKLLSDSLQPSLLEPQSNLNQDDAAIIENSQTETQNEDKGDRNELLDKGESRHMVDKTDVNNETGDPMQCDQIDTKKHSSTEKDLAESDKLPLHDKAVGTDEQLETHDDQLNMASTPSPEILAKTPSDDQLNITNSENGQEPDSLEAELFDSNELRQDKNQKDSGKNETPSSIEKEDVKLDEMPSDSIETVSHSNELKSISGINKEGEQLEAPADSAEIAVNQSTSADYKAQSDGQVDVSNTEKEPEPDSLETVIYDSDEPNIINSSDEKACMESDDSQLTQEIDLPDGNTPGNLTQAATNTEADVQNNSEVLPEDPDSTKASEEETRKTSENVHSDIDSNLPCGDGNKDKEIKEKTEYSKDVHIEKSGDAQASGFSDSDANIDNKKNEAIISSTEEPNLIDKNKSPDNKNSSDGNENKTSNLEDLSQCTQVPDSDLQSASELKKNSTFEKDLMPDTQEDEELKLSTDQSCGLPESRKSVDGEKLDSDEDDACSSQSFEFDINACLSERASEEKAVEKLKDDIIEALEELLSDDKGDIQDKIEAKTELTTQLKECDEEGKEKGTDNSTTNAESKDDPNRCNKTQQDVIQETIEIVSDSDDDDVHLDVTMEEIISDGSSVTVEYFSDREGYDKVKEIQEIEPINPNYIKEEEVVTETNDSKGDDLADELLELLREVEVTSEINDIDSQIPKPTSDKTESRAADEIFKILEEESDSDSSITDLNSVDVNLSSSDLEWIEDDNSNETIPDKNKDKIESEQLLQEFNAKECYVAVERLEMNEYEVVKVNKKMNDSIDRLCDINSLLKKRKYTAVLDGKSGPKRVKRSKQGTSDINSDYDSSDFTDSETEKDEINIDNVSTLLPTPLEQKLDDMLANEICNVLNTSNDSTDYDSDDSNKKTKKKKNKHKREESKHSDSDKKEKLSKEELIKKSWKNDPLLRGKLTSSESDSSSSSSTSSSEKSRKRRNALKSKYEHDTDYYIVSDTSDTDSDSSTTRKQNKVLMEEKTISPIKKNIPISDSDSTDSEIEFVPQQKTPKKTDSSVPEDDELPSGSQKGRRNIRGVLSDESLAEATQRANREEQERIERLEDRHRIKESFSQSFSQTDEVEEEDSLILDVDVNTGEPIIKVHPGLNKKLKPHQRDGIQFMWDSCYESVDRLKIHEGSGCILAHCMGLGKTFQVLALIHALFANEVTNTKHVLVVCPLSTVNNWKKEVRIFFKDLPQEKFDVQTIADKKETCKKYEIVKKWRLKRKSVLVMGYEGFETLTNECKLDKGGPNLRERMLEALVDPGPDLVICDEGHLLRNKKALKTLALNRIRTKRRIVLTGTPLQNNLLEYYYMVQFVKPNLLGNMKEFKTNFVNPITNGQYEDSTKDDIKLMMKRTHVLHKLLKKSIQRVEDTELKIYLPKIVDYAIFIQLHEVQVEMYNKFSELVQANSAYTNRKGFLSDFIVFQYIGTHPYLLPVIDEMKNKKIKERDLITNEQDNPICNIDGWWKAKVPEDAADKISYGNKLMVVKSILEECEELGDKVLLFSQSLGELDVIEHFLKKVGTTKCPSWKKKVDYFRMDGTVCPEYRSTICDLFNDKDNKNIRLLLMSTKVGGLGLNLTAANRVIIMTVNWNPSLDTQSVFRVYRFGQEKAVFVYRLISLDTMEEKVYQRTVTKLAIAHRVVDKHQITRHYKSMDLQELYSCQPKAEGERTMPHLPEDQILGKLILKLPFIFRYHEHQALLANRPEDNLNEQELNAAWDEFKKIKDAANIVPPPMLPQVSTTNGPTFNAAFALARSVPVATNKSAGGTDIEEKALQQYYIPKPYQPVLQQKNGQPNNSTTANHPKGTLLKHLNGMNTNTFIKKIKGNLENIVAANKAKVNSNRNANGTNSNTFAKKTNLPADAVATTNSNPDNLEMIPIPSSTSSKSSAEQDPLYIGQISKSVKSYNELLKQFSNDQQIPKLPKSTSIFLQNDLPKTNRRENIANRRRKSLNVPTDESSSIVIDDNDTDHSLLRVPVSVSQGNITSNANKNKRKHNDHSQDKDLLIKKMKQQFNDSQESINLDDDDDDVTEVTDTTSDSGSLSNDIVKSLGRSGITIHKVVKESNKNNNIITLD